MKKIFITFLLIFSFSAIANERTIQVKGEWTTTIKDDKAAITLSIVSLNQDPKLSSRESDRIYNNLVKEVTLLKLKDSNLSTISYQLNEKYSWEKRKKIFEGYTTTIRLKVETSEIKRIGDVIAKARNVGVNEIGNLETYISKETKDKTYNLGLTKAINDAKIKADLMLNELGAKRAEVLTIIEGKETFIPGPRPVFSMAKSMREDAPAPAEIQGGDSEVKVNVTVTFKIN